MLASTRLKNPESAVIAAMTPSHMMEDSDKILFGDVFSQRADYSSGILYRSRRTYLSPVNQVWPPTTLRTKRQAHRSEGEFKRRAPIRFSDDVVDNSANIRPPSRGTKVPMFQRSAKNALSSLKSKKIIVIDKFSTTNWSAWSEEMKAGVQLYVNKETGEVFDECPWHETENSRRSTVGIWTSFKPVSNSTAKVGDYVDKFWREEWIRYRSSCVRWRRAR
jgi:hypothetical protein